MQLFRRRKSGGDSADLPVIVNHSGDRGSSVLGEVVIKDWSFQPEDLRRREGSHLSLRLVRFRDGDFT